ncbi:nickel-dependent hydrogenase large subunit [Geoalkalibacter halelectricus]|uniref:nickel-dependent hydrogenase large subunit n=1 Tax=Geoalkalibacter halelectricus TaxID=2847045 RepID=UPI003D1E6597
MAKIVLDPVTRIEGHLRIETQVAAGRVTKAWSKGEMFRGFEALLQGRDPLDAPVITQRICGVCPISHALSSCKAIESATGLNVPANGRYLRNLILGANYLQSHILHFYHLSALDFVQVEALLDYSGRDPVLLDLKHWAQSELNTNRVLPVAPFLPKLPGDYAQNAQWNLGALSNYVEALDIRREAHRMAALVGGKMPHAATLVPGGVTCATDADMLEDFRSRLRRVRRFIERCYIPDVLQAARLYPEYAAVGRGVARFLSYGVFDEEGATWMPAGTLNGRGHEHLDLALIHEDTTTGFYRGNHKSHPQNAPSPIPQADKPRAYSWLKAPRYNGLSYEVGPLARIMVAAAAGEPSIVDPLTDFLREARLGQDQLASTLGRHAARAFEAQLIAARMENWLDAVTPGTAAIVPYKNRDAGNGVGLIEAPRGALGHWISLKSGRIGSYQCIVPSTWNFSPRDGDQNPGPVESALVGTAVNPEFKGLEVARVVRSFDPCIACAVH